MHLGTESTGNVTITGCDMSKLANKHLLFVEDIIDTGMYVCMYVCVCIYIYMYTYTHAYMYMCIHTHIHVA